MKDNVHTNLSNNASDAVYNLFDASGVNSVENGSNILPDGGDSG
jgi:hypothetical protein